MKIDFNIYLITDRHATTLGLPEAVRLALKGGVRAVQLREKDLPVRELLPWHGSSGASPGSSGRSFSSTTELTWQSPSMPTASISADRVCLRRP